MALSDNLISYWKFDESSGNAADSVGSNTLTNINTTSYVAGKINNGADVEVSSSQGFSIADASQSGLDLSGDLTFSVWFKMESAPSGGEGSIIVKRIGAGNNRSYHWKLNNGGTQIGLLWYTDGSSVGGNLSVAWTPSTATWYHMAVTKSGTTAKFYVNGAQQGTDQTGSSATIHNGTAPFEVAYWSDDAGFVDGVLDEMGVWSRALSDSEISSLYNGGSGLGYPFASSYTSTLTETATVTASVVKSTTRTLADAATVTDSIIRSLTRTLSEAVTNTDVFSGLRVAAATLSEAVTVADSIVRSITRDLSEAISNTDTIVRSITRTLSESAVVTDVLTTLRATYATLTEAVTATDAIVRSITRNLSEAVTNTDVLTTVRTFIRTLTESLSLTDVFSRTFVVTRTFVESVTLTDTLQKLRNGLSIFWTNVARAVSSWVNASRNSSVWDNEDRSNV